VSDAASDQVPPSRVLVVDDNPQNLELLQAYMEELPNVQTLTATNGLEALEQVARHNPDLVLLDIMMPRMSGFEVCKKLKESEATKDIPVVMVTALNELADIERGVECGTDDFLTKPVNRLELLTRVRSLLRVRHLKGELNRTLAYLDEMESPPSGDEKSGD
jgi:two-component system alkaline phosphatase synthesis response regulator PhoP